MLSAEENKLVTQVGPGTPTGDLMRRYWMPFAAVSELDDNPTKPVRLMGEDLVVYKDRNGTYGLVDRQCPHRRADMSYGFVEDCGLRCNYHGWLFDEQGQCIDQPFEEVAHPEAHYKDRVRIKSYKVQPKAGLLWAYMGPDPVPELWDWDIYYDRGYKQVVFSEIPCNWLQCQENSIDPVHFEWLHSNWSVRLKGQEGPYSPTHVKVGFDEFEYGFIYRRVRTDTTEEDELWSVGRTCLWPNCLYTGDHFEWRVPIDDENTLSVGWFLDRIPGEQPFEQERIPYWHAPIKDEKTGRWITTHVMNQDFVAWVGQGTTSDRWNEHLGDSDRGIIIIRKRLMDDTKVIADGGDPKAVLRDPAQNHRIWLPRFGNGNVSTSVTGDARRAARAARANGPRPFAFLAGQPQEITDELNEVWQQHAATLS
ncbi:MAG TPA: aromatic ring-hydroxylating dioxygenase subunit alpha [Dehalococcoidia bacterium]|nr:aromatic ring-hydroxylating dioxygenase subunit alpha [Dehalococcoidia bacterium]